MIEPRKDPYEGVVLHHTLFDWSDPTLDADEITARLIGTVPHWDLPEYEGMKPWEVERKILCDAKRPNWGGKSKHGKPYYQHFLTLMRLMFPQTDITPSLADAMLVFCIGVTHAKKIENLIGSTNAGKSAFASRLAFVLMYVDPEYTAVYVANPFDNAADSTVWGDLEELWDQLIEAHPNRTGKGTLEAPGLFPLGRKYADRYIEFIPNTPKAARIELRNTKHVGKYKGSKMRGKDVDRGVLLVIIDEVNEIENMSFLTTLSNIASQAGFFCVTSQNFKDPEDMGGRMTEPVATYGGPASFDELSMEDDAIWHSAASSITLRFDGHRSPNILAGRTVYPKLFHAGDRQRLLEDYGEQSPEYYSQARSFPARTSESNSVLSRAKISASRHLDRFYTTLNVKGRFAFCDPAFGGRDKAAFGWGSIVDATVTEPSGDTQRTEVLLEFTDFFTTLKLVKDAIYNDYWFERMTNAGIQIKDFVEGSEVSYEDQIAIQCRELLKRHNIPAANFGYDFSMRPDIVSSMNRMIGFSANAFDYNQPPEGVFLQNLKKNSEDCCKNRCTELAFLAADYFLTKQVRGGNYIEAAITQLSRTLYETKNNKYLAEGKKEYKARWQQVSPDMRDVLMGICGMAHRRGFRQTNVSTGTPTKSAFSALQGVGRGKSIPQKYKFK